MDNAVVIPSFFHSSLVNLVANYGPLSDMIFLGSLYHFYMFFM